MLFWSVLGASIGSALLPLINIEAILAVAVGRYAKANHESLHRHLQKPKAKASLDRWHARAEGRPWFTAGLLFVSASLGFPPYAVTAVLAGVLRVPFWIFLLTGLLGRGLRFWAVVTGTSSLIDLF